MSTLIIKDSFGYFLLIILYLFEVKKLCISNQVTVIVIRLVISIDSDRLLYY
jgi:hypothetical protein